MVISQTNNPNNGTSINYVFITYSDISSMGISINSSFWRSPKLRTNGMYMSFHLEIVYE